MQSHDAIAPLNPGDRCRKPAGVSSGSPGEEPDEGGRVGEAGRRPTAAATGLARTATKV
jgi:hypothetical protein